jgi:RimJ/RimL family protein N-acetyltransferase
MAHGWEGEKVRLVPLDKSAHLDNCLRWINDREVTENVLMGDFPMSRQAEEAWFDQESGSQDPLMPQKVVFAVETLAGEHIGLSSFHRFDYRNGDAWTGTIIGRKDLWGKGYASDAVAVRTRYAFEVIGLRYLSTEVFHDNVAMQRVLTKNGYREVGRIPRATWKRGRYRDVMIFWIDREAWQAHRAGGDAASE